MSTTEAIPATALDAVNVMLASIGSSAVNSLEVVDTNTDAENALIQLTSTSREVQIEGWDWNTERELPISPDGNGHINLPLNCLTVQTEGKSKALRLVERDSKLYDPRKHTFAIAETVYLKMVVALAFESIPEAARWYITVKAARRFAMTKLPSTATYQYSADDESKARALCERTETETNDETMATANPHVRRMRRK